MKFVSITPSGAMIFDSLLQTKPAFVKFYHPQCGHCQDMAPEWAALEKEKSNLEDIDINIIEVHADAIPNIKSECAKQLQGYPTIMAVPKGGGKGPEHKGERTCTKFIATIRNMFGRQRGGRRVRRTRNRRVKRGRKSGTKRGRKSGTKTGRGRRMRRKVASQRKRPRYTRKR